MSDIHASTMRALIGELVQLEHLITHTRRHHVPGDEVVPVGVQLRAQLARRRRIIGELRLRRARQRIAVTRPWPGLLGPVGRAPAAGQRDETARSTTFAVSDRPQCGTDHRTTPQRSARR